MTSQQLYLTYTQKMQRIADIRSASAVLQWDQETYLPSGGAHFRGQQISTLSELAHQLFVEDALGDLLTDLVQKDDLSPQQKRNVERSLDDYTKSKKYPSSFVRKLSEQVNKAFHSWNPSKKTKCIFSLSK